MKKIFTPIKINNKTLKNRVIVPPMVIFGADTLDGYVDEWRVEHYRKFAKGGCGMVIVEATCIDPDGRLGVCQLGLWEDGQIEGMKRIADAIKAEGTVAIVQIHHGGGNTDPKVCETPLSPTEMMYRKRMSRTATIEELEKTQQQFIDACIRAQKAGFDGIELHGCHGYLLCELNSPVMNKRTDKFGGTQDKRISMMINVTKAVREACGKDFIVGCRMAGFEPTYEEGVYNAKALVDAGVDYLHVSWGFKDPERPLTVPEGFICDEIVYGASVVKHAVNVPIIAVNGINTIERGEWLIKNGHADMVAYARPHLASYDITNRALAGDESVICKGCKVCMCFKDYKLCLTRQ